MGLSWMRMALAVAVLFGSFHLCGQGALMPPETPAVPTLRVVTTRVQFTALVLKSPYEGVAGLLPEQFMIKLDSRPPFKPSNVRSAENDPLDISVLVDREGASKDLADSIGVLAKSLRPDDRLKLFTLDCVLMASAPLSHDAKQMQDAYVLMMAKQTAYKKEHQCPQAEHLWDALRTALLAMHGEPGRQVLLAISDGHDWESETNLDDVIETAIRQGSAIFAVPTIAYMPNDVLGADLYSLANSSGGCVLQSAREAMANRLQSFMKMLRARYVLEFPRPNYLEPGRHQIEVIVKGYTVLTTGTYATVADKKMMRDPSMVRYDEFFGPAGHGLDETSGPKK